MRGEKFFMPNFWNPYDFNAYSGYCKEKNMSNRAVDAYAGGEKPLHKWTKEALDKAIKNLELEEAIEKALLKLPLKAKKTFLKISSWHHTGKNYKKTDFYSFKDISLVKIENVLKFSKEWKDWEKSVKEYSVKKEELIEKSKTDKRISVQPFSIWCDTIENIFDGVKIPVKILNFAKNDLEFSCNGNAYKKGEKPTSLKRGDGLERLEFDREENRISLTKYDKEKDKYQVVESLILKNISIRDLNLFCQNKYEGTTVKSECILENPIINKPCLIL